MEIESGGATFVEFHEAVFEFSVVFYLMHMNAHHAADLDSDCWSRMDEDWVVSHGKGFRANIILWGMPIGTLVRLRFGLIKLADLASSS